MTPSPAAELPARPAQFWDPRTRPGYDASGVFNVYSYQDVLRVLTDAETMSGDYGITDEAAPHVNPESLGLWMAGGKRHKDLKAAAADAFRRERVNELGPRIRALAHQLLDPVVAREERHLDVVTEFARPFHLQVTCLILGVDPRHAPMFDDWIVASAASSAVDTVAPQPDETRFFRALIKQRRAHPQHGLVDELIALLQDGYVVGDRPMTEWDLIGHFAMLVAAGYETATGIANAVLFADTWGVLDQLYAAPMLLADWGEETWRSYPPFPAARRRVVAATTLGGQRLRAGTWVLGWLTAANRAPDQFPDPNQYNIRRSPNRHLSFGHGRRSCLGAALARLEMTIALQALLERLPGLRRDRSESLTRTYGIVDSLQRLPCTFAAPGRRP